MRQSGSVLRRNRNYRPRSRFYYSGLTSNISFRISGTKANRGSDFARVFRQRVVSIDLLAPGKPLIHLQSLYHYWLTYSGSSSNDVSGLHLL